MLSASIEDYIKAIYALEAEHAKATTKEIADRLEVKMASVTGMMKHLAAEGYVKHTPYRGVQLTVRGRHVALGMIRRHRLIELFLSQTLGLSWDAVHADADTAEHTDWSQISSSSESTTTSDGPNSIRTVHPSPARTAPSPHPRGPPR
jgi:DtxR family Mn-dependent transcriptional regulator